MKRASYKEAVFWIAANDDTEWLNPIDYVSTPSVTACFVADIFAVSMEKLIKDIERQKKKMTQTKATGQ